jgi:fluoride exporter
MLGVAAFVALGSALGGVARFLVSSTIQERAATTFPLGTLVVNITGSLLLGFVLRYALATPSISPEVRALLTTGFCGGYTTFSTYSYETAMLIQGGDYRRAAAYALASVSVALAGTFLGFAAAGELLRLQEGG